MADFCCSNQGETKALWSGDYPLLNKWYPVSIGYLKKEIAQQLGVSVESHPMDSNSEKGQKLIRTGQSKIRVGLELIKIATPSLWDLTWEEIFPWRLAIAIGMTMILEAIIILSVIRPGKGAVQVKGVDLGNGKIKPQNREAQDSQPTAAEGRLPPTTSETPVAEPLIEAVKQAFLIAPSQRLQVELVLPPQTSDWVTFIRMILEELELRPAGRGTGTQGGISFDTDSGQGTSSFEASVPRPGFGAKRIYVELQTAYSDGSAALGGKPVFRETNDPGVSFCVAIGERGTGLLEPNPRARTYDSAYYQFFKINRNEFPVNKPVEAQEVRKDGNQWVLASSAW